MSKKFVVYFSFDEEDNKYVGVCPEYVGFIIYCEDFLSLKKESIRMLKAYEKNSEISGENVDFVEKTIAKELEV